MRVWRANVGTSKLFPSAHLRRNWFLVLSFIPTMISVVLVLLSESVACFMAPVIQQQPHFGNSRLKVSFTSEHETTFSSPVETKNVSYGDSAYSRSSYLHNHRQREGLTEIGKEFRDMIEQFSRYTESEIYSVKDARIRSLLEGVAESSYEPAVYRAFEVLYEDFMPIRLAGRFIYNKLKQLVADSQIERQQEVEKIATVTGLSTEDVEQYRIAFLTAAENPTDNRRSSRKGDDSELVLTKKQMEDSGFLVLVAELLEYDNADELFVRVDEDNDGEITFHELIVGLQNIAEESCFVNKCDPAKLLQLCMERSKRTSTKSILAVDPRRQKHSDRYDEMVETFRKWKDFIPAGEGRRLDILRGCFVGAENEKIVKALKIVYVDYSALRVAGNTIFSLTSAIMAPRLK